MVVEVHPFGKLIKADIHDGREGVVCAVHHAKRRVRLRARRKVVKFPNRGQEDGNEGQVPESAQSALKFGKYAPYPTERGTKQALRLIPAYDHMESVVFFHIQAVDNLFPNLSDSQDCGKLL